MLYPFDCFSVQALAQIFPPATWLLLFLQKTVNTFLADFPEENKIPLHRQSQSLVFCRKGRRDLRFFRSFLHGIHQFWVPIIGRRLPYPVIAQVIVHTDASGQIDIEEGEPGPALGVVIPTQPGTIARACSFPLPMQWLTAEDNRSANHHNTLLLEGKKELVVKT